jgi:hypothetical protein
MAKEAELKGEVGEHPPTEAELGAIDRRRFGRRSFIRRLLTTVGLVIGVPVTGGIGLSIVAVSKRPKTPVDPSEVLLESIREVDPESQRTHLGAFLKRFGSPIWSIEETRRTLVEVTKVRTKVGKEYTDITFLPEWAGETFKPKSYLDVEPVTFRLEGEGDNMELVGVIARSHWNLIYAGKSQFKDQKSPSVVLSPGFHTPIFDLQEGDWPNFYPQEGRSDLLSRDTYYIQSNRVGSQAKRIRTEKWTIGGLEENHPGRMGPWH